MEAGVRRVTWLSGLTPDAEATLYGAIIAGTFALLGVLVERLLRLAGRLRCYPSRWDTEFAVFRADGSHVRAKRPENATHLRYRFAIDLYNGMEAPAGLRDVAVMLVGDDGTRFTSQPQDLSSVGINPSLGNRWTVDKVYVINVTPRQFVRVEIAGVFGAEAKDALVAGKWRRVEFEAKRPKRPLLWRKTYRKTIVER